jgi:arginyl-tRNA synthetase
MIEKHWSYNRTAADVARGRLIEEQEALLLNELMRFPEVVLAAAEARGPQILSGFLRELAAAFHSYYNAVAILVPDDELRNARMGLCLAVKQVLANGLRLLGVSAPERM